MPPRNEFGLELCPENLHMRKIRGIIAVPEAIFCP
jgi:hypothetical protein